MRVADKVEVWEGVAAEVGNWAPGDGRQESCRVCSVGSANQATVRTFAPVTPCQMSE